MRLTDFAALSFDCYGTLIDWETGILATLRPWADRHGLGIGDDALLAEFSRIEPALQAARPATLYPDVLAGTFHALGRHFGCAVSDDEAGAFGQSVKDWPAFADSAGALAFSSASLSISRSMSARFFWKAAEEGETRDWKTGIRGSPPSREGSGLASAAGSANSPWPADHCAARRRRRRPAHCAAGS